MTDAAEIRDAVAVIAAMDRVAQSSRRLAAAQAEMRAAEADWTLAVRELEASRG